MWLFGEFFPCLVVPDRPLMQCRALEALEAEPNNTIVILVVPEVATIHAPWCQKRGHGHPWSQVKLEDHERE
jgi:hypothetical protein